MMAEKEFGGYKEAFASFGPKKNFFVITRKLRTPEIGCGESGWQARFSADKVEFVLNAVGTGVEKPVPPVPPELVELVEFHQRFKHVPAVLPALLLIAANRKFAAFEIECMKRLMAASWCRVSGGEMVSTRMRVGRRKWRAGQSPLFGDIVFLDKIWFASADKQLSADAKKIVEVVGGDLNKFSTHWVLAALYVRAGGKI